MVCQTVTWGVFEGLVLMQFSLDDSMDDGSRQRSFYKHRSRLRKQQRSTPDRMEVRHNQTGSQVLTRKHHTSDSAVWYNHWSISDLVGIGMRVIANELRIAKQYSAAGINSARCMTPRAPVKAKKNVYRQTVLTRMLLCNYFEQNKGE